MSSKKKIYVPISVLAVLIIFGIFSSYCYSYDFCTLFVGLIGSVFMAFFWSDHSINKPVIYLIKWCIYSLLVNGLYFIVRLYFEVPNYVELPLYDPYTQKIYTFSHEGFIVNNLIYSEIIFLIIILLRCVNYRIWKYKGVSIFFGVLGYKFAIFILLGEYMGGINFVKGGISITSKLINLRDLGVFIGAFLLVFLGLGYTYFLIYRKRIERYKNVKNEYYSEANRIVIGTLADTFNVRMINLTWLIFYAHNIGRIYKMVVDDEEFRYENYIVTSYRNDHIRSTADSSLEDTENTIFYYLFFSIHAWLLSSKEKKEIVDFLSAKKEAGYTIIVKEIGMGSGLGRVLAQSKFIYMRNNDLDIMVPETIKACKVVQSTKNELIDFGSDIDRIDNKLIKDIIEKKYNSMINEFDIVGDFYSLISLVQFIISVRGLSKWAEGRFIPFNNQFEATFGGMKSLQNTDEKCNDLKVCVAYNVLKLIQQDKDYSSLVKQFERDEQMHLKAVSYNDITSLLVNIRNDYVGHGVMVYMVNEEILYYLTICVRYVFQVFLKEYSCINLDGMIKVGENEDKKTIPPFYVSGGIIKRLYIYTKKIKKESDDENIVVYLDYITGKYICCDVSDNMHRKRYSIKKEI